MMAEAPEASAVIAIRNGEVLSTSSVSPAREVLEVMGDIADDALGRRHSVALGALFARLRRASPGAPQEQFREVMIVSDSMAFIIQRFPGSEERALVSVHRADRRLGMLMADARHHLDEMRAGPGGKASR